MSIRIASHAGFCFGVQRAVDRLEKALEGARGTNRKVYTLGRIIHNSHYIEHVKSLGAEEISRGDIPEIIRRADEGDEITVVIRAHGEITEISRGKTPETAGYFCFSETPHTPRLRE